MRQLALAAATLMTVVASTTGCGHFSRKEAAYEYDLEVTGAAATSISVTSPRDDDARTYEIPDTTLPFRKKAVAVLKKTGPLTLRVMPKDGDATCRIGVEGKEAVKKSGPAGTELVCSTTLKGIR